MRRNRLLTGALILTAANLITRFMGFFYRIFMSRTLGAEGMGLYQLIMPLYMLAWTITASGFTTTVSKLTAQENAKGQYGNTRQFLKQATFFCGVIGCIVGVGLFLTAAPVAQYIIKDVRTLPSLRLIGLAFPCMAMGSCIRGFFFGLQENGVPAASQVLEQVVRIAVVMAIAPMFMPLGLEMACLAAIIGIIAGEILSFFFVFFRYKRQKRMIPIKSPSISQAASATLILSMALPLTAGRVVGSLLSTAENILIPQRLTLFGDTSGSALAQYGQLTGMAMPLIQLPSALLMAVSISLVPAISEAVAIHHLKRMDYTISKTLLMTCIIGIGTAGFFAMFADPVCMLIYNQQELGMIVVKLAALCPFLYLQITLSGILNGLGLHNYILRNNMISSVINLAFIYFLMPMWGIDAFIWGWFFSLVATVAMSLFKVSKTAYLHIDFPNWVLKPLFAMIVSAVFGRILSNLLPQRGPAFLFAAALMMGLYCIMLILLGVLDKTIFGRN